MKKMLGFLACLALAGAGCSSATQQPVDSGSGTDGGGTVDAAGSDAGGGDDVGTDAATIADAGHDAAPRTDAGMCVDDPPGTSRPAPVTCMACRPPGPSGGTGGTCATDADCNDTTMGSNGRCLFGRIGPYCSYDACFDDGDCQATEVCLCDGNDGANTCVPADCHVDADCGVGLACAPTLGTCGHYLGFVAYRCHTSSDECTVDSDCAAGYCAFDETLGHWACSTAECVG